MGIWKKLEHALIEKNEDEFEDLLIEAMITTEKMDILSSILEKLFFIDNDEINYLIFETLLLHEDSLTTAQHAELMKKIKLNYEKIKLRKFLSLMAEWVGGLRNQWSLEILEYWCSQNLNQECIRFLQTAFFEFLEGDSHHTDENLEKAIRKLKDSMV